MKNRLSCVLLFLLYGICQLKATGTNCFNVCRCADQHVNCEDRQLTNISWVFPRNTSSISLSNNRLRYIPETAFTEASSSIRALDFSHNKLTNFPRTVLKLTVGLKTLNLSNNEIVITFQDLQTPLFNRNLLVLDLSNNRIAYVIPALFSSLRNLVRLRLHGNSLTIFSLHFVIYSRYLKELTLQNNEIANLAFHVGVGISDLNLTQNKFKFSNNSEIFKATTSLKRLWIGHAGLHYFPITFNGINSIEELTISYISQAKIDTTILQPCANSLKKLYLNEGNLTVLDVRKMKVLRRLGVSNMHSLTTLRLEDIPLSTLENLALRGIEGLSQVYLDQLGLAEFTSTSFSTPNQITHLSTRGNFIRLLTNNSFTTLGNLRSLNLSRNRISHIDSGAFAGLLNLEILDLSDNRLTIFDGSILNSPHLNTLILSNNFLVRLSFNPNAALIMNLDIRNNRIQNFPSFPDHRIQARLSGNHWQCTCSMLNSLSHIDVLDSCDGNNSCVYCDTPSEFRGQKISSMSDKCIEAAKEPIRIEIILGIVLGVVLIVTILVLIIWKVRRIQQKSKRESSSNNNRNFTTVVYQRA
ncbi:uncharacterized protein LOC100181603 [Ciona intestinalis]